MIYAQCLAMESNAPETNIPTQFRALRERAGLSLDALAKALGYKAASSIQRYESPDYAKPYLNADLIGKLMVVLTGKGSPPIASREILAMGEANIREIVRDTLKAAGYKRSNPKSPIGSYDPDFITDEPREVAMSAALVDGRVSFQGRVAGSSPEIAAAAGAGEGQIDGSEARVSSNGIVIGHPVNAEWLIPADYVRHSLDARPSSIVILPVVGHSMEPMLYANDRILVDTSQNAWIGDAVYVIDDGSTVFQVKTLRKIPSSFPPRFEIVSESTPDRVFERGHEDFRIVGRVVGRFTRM